MSTLDELNSLCRDLGHPVLTSAPDSAGRFPDGSRYKVEIPSCEGPAVMEAVLEEAAARGVRIDRISQGSGVMMLTDAEIGRIAALGAEHGVEVSLRSVGYALEREHLRWKRPRHRLALRPETWRQAKGG